MLDAFLEFRKIGTARARPEAAGPPRAVIANRVEDASVRGATWTLTAARGVTGDRHVVRLRPDGDFCRAVDNLISNAVRYGARAEVPVLRRDKRHYGSAVEDDGPAIPEDLFVT